MSGERRVIAGRYTLEAPLGQGGFGSVWRATDGATGSAVAVKLLHAELAAFGPTLDRFRREAELLRRLEHRHLAPALDFGAAEGEAYLVMPLVEGRNLKEELGERGGPLPLDQAAAVVRQVAAALDYVHERGVVHRDLKPANVVLASGSEVRAVLVDFGIAKRLDLAEDQATTVGRLLGSFLYLSPEQVAGEGVGPATDIFALAVIAFELLAGRRLFARDEDGRPQRVTSERLSFTGANHVQEIVRRITLEDRPRASTFRPDLPGEVDGVLARALAFAAADRPAHAGLFAEALDAALIGRAPRPTTRAETLAAPGLEDSTLARTALALPEPTLLQPAPSATALSPPPEQVTRTRLLPPPRRTRWWVGLLALTAGLGAAALTYRASMEPEVVQVLPTPTPAARSTSLATRTGSAAPSVTPAEPGAAEEPPAPVPPPAAPRPSAPDLRRARSEEGRAPPRFEGARPGSRPDPAPEAPPAGPEPPPEPELARRIAELVERPDPVRFQELARAVEVAAERRGDPALASRTRRCTASAGLMSSASELSRCLAALGAPR